MNFARTCLTTPPLISLVNYHHGITSLRVLLVNKRWRQLLVTTSMPMVGRNLSAQSCAFILACWWHVCKIKIQSHLAMQFGQALRCFAKSSQTSNSLWTWLLKSTDIWTSNFWKMYWCDWTFTTYWWKYLDWMLYYWIIFLSSTFPCRK